MNLTITIGDKTLQTPIRESRQEECVLECLQLLNKYRKMAQIV